MPAPSPRPKPASSPKARNPTIPPGLLDDSDAAPAGTRFNLADGVYSAGLRSAAPEPVVREAVHLLSRVADLSAPLSTGVTLRLIYARTPRSKGQASRVIYAALSGGAAGAECYAFELSDGSYRCFVREDAEPAPLPPAAPARLRRGSAPLPPERSRPGAGGGGGGAVADSGAAAVGGLLAPIKGAPVTSLFGMRFHPILHITRLHAGIDFGAAVGSQSSRLRRRRGRERRRGARLRQRASCSSTAATRRPTTICPKSASKSARKVRQGEIIALSGNSGLSTGPHLHFEYRVNGDPQDPMPHMGREVQGRAPAVASASAYTPAPAGPSVPVPPAGSRPPPPDPAMLAAFAAAKADIDATLAAADR